MNAPSEIMPSHSFHQTGADLGSYINKLCEFHPFLKSEKDQIFSQIFFFQIIKVS